MLINNPPSNESNFAGTIHGGIIETKFSLMPNWLYFCQLDSQTPERELLWKSLTPRYTRIPALRTVCPSAASHKRNFAVFSDELTLC